MTEFLWHCPSAAASARPKCIPLVAPSATPLETANKTSPVLILLHTPFK